MLTQAEINIWKQKYENSIIKVTKYKTLNKEYKGNKCFGTKKAIIVASGLSKKKKKKKKKVDGYNETYMLGTLKILEIKKSRIQHHTVYMEDLLTAANRTVNLISGVDSSATHATFNLNRKRQSYKAYFLFVYKYSHTTLKKILSVELIPQNVS